VTLSAKHTALVTISAVTRELRVASILVDIRNLLADIAEEAPLLLPPLVECYLKEETV
jgi:hypothetical protein